MDWLKELLKKAGIDESKIDGIVGDMNKEMPKYLIPKDKYNEVSEAKKQLENDIKERDKQLKDLEGEVKGNEELEKTIKVLQETNKTTKEQYEAKLKDMTINAAIQSKLTDTKYPDLLTTKFDKTKLAVNTDGSVTGIDEQLTAIKEQYKDLFMPVIEGREPYNKEKNPNGIKNPWSKEHFNLTEQGKLLRENPELAKQLMASTK
ncbi:phage scaffolding protein [Sporanaerobacter sp. PP17-6a]|uniref:phage scaffolding protein n=1 Tax=Sporanaerobacter sp. PP17-6a TaxID=1891289 RepID=UPI0008A06D9E|nr:phage scaffolding protein [Sporanaerobacter sp. PP17-6a]SCL85080.1 Phage minor structural protein GP20 [Sporanaerobacter sp. PP17-6a]